MASRGPGPVAGRLSIATRLALLVVLVATASLAITAGVALDRGATLVREAAVDRLDAVAGGRADEVAGHVRGLRARISALAGSPATADAIAGFAAALDQLGAEPATPEVEDRLADLYLAEVVPPLEAARGEPVPLTTLLPVTDAAVRLQAGWLTAGEGEVPPSAVDDNRDGTAWTDLHTVLHPAYRRIAEGSGFTDLAFVSAAGVVVYTVDKGIDLGTDLAVGPHSGGMLAVTARAIAADPQAGETVVSDLARTQAAGERPTGVVASPVFDDDRFVGVVAGQYDAVPLSRIMAAGGDWTGLGRTGQVYLASGDGTMRSDARDFVADPQRHMDAASEQLTPAQETAMRVLGTTVAYQPVDADLVRAAASGPGRGRALSPTGVSVAASWRPVDVDGPDWVVVAEVSVAELEEPLAWLGRAVLVSVALVVLVTTFVAVAWANRLVEPLRRVADRLRRARTEDPAAPPPPAPTLGPRAPREYRELSDDIEDMLTRLRARGEDLRRRRAERLALLHQFLPPAMADRAEAGEQDVLDRIERASVVIVQLRGVGGLLRRTARDDSRVVLDALVDDLDTAAQQHGLERFRLSGDSYAAVCGASRPYLDHAPRGLAFARASRHVVAATAAATGTPMTVGVGLASGPVVVGLTGGDRLVFDCWGPTVERAIDLARAAGDGELLVDETARSLLPDEVATTTPPGGQPPGALRVSDTAVSTAAET